MKYKYFLAKAFNLAVVVAILVMFSSWAYAAQASDKEVEEQIIAAERAANRGPYTADGTFTGSAQGFGGKVKMQVTVENGYIEDVQILDASHEDDAWLDMAIVLLDEIKSENTTDLDVVSGATYTSSGILNGCTEALNKSLAGEAS